MTSLSPQDERILVLLPTARDGERTRAALRDAELECVVCGDLDELCRELVRGAGAALLTEEALAADRSGRLMETLRRQPPWSDFPLLILAHAGAGERPTPRFESVNATLIERPVRLRSLLSLIRAALRSRHRQYEVRGYMVERERQASALREQEERLQFALAAGRLGSWDVILATGQLECSALCKEHFGRLPEQPFLYEDLFAAIHPDEREQAHATIQRAIAERTSCDIEVRTLWPDGTSHWILLRGRAKYGRDGAALRMSGVSLDMTDRRRDEEALRDADRKKDDFLALLAHELRNPLAPVRNSLQVLRLTGDQAVRERAEKVMARQLGHMVRLIDDLLDVSRINRNKMELRIARITLADVVSSAVETARPAVEEAGHELTIQLPADPVMLDADLTRLAQVFANLLTNSAKYTERGGRIALRAVQTGAEVVVTVEDSGIGIPEESLRTIFNMFSQVDRKMERTGGGLGIGLALVQGLVEMHGGSVMAASAGIGKGSQFTVRLPIVPAPKQPASTPASEPRSPSGPPRRILVVDDNRDAAESMAEMLRLLGHTVDVAYDGLHAVAQAATFRPEVVLMDVGMPSLNGLDATRRIRAQPGGKEMTIIALTGFGQASDRLRSSQAGCDGHLVKPVTFDALNQLLTRLKAPTRST